MRLFRILQLTNGLINNEGIHIIMQDFIALKRRILENEYNYLNSVQKEAVFHTNGAMLILAGAGSGKTTTLVSKIAYLIKYGDAYYNKSIPGDIGSDELEMLELMSQMEGVPPKGITEMIAHDRLSPYNILAFTFTNKAAGEMRERIIKIVGEAAVDMWISTFHSICVRILRTDIARLSGYDKSFVIYDTSDTQTLMKNCLQRLNISEKTCPPRDMLSAIGRAKDKLIDYTEYAKQAMGDYKLERIAEVYTAYQKRLKDNNALDFDDIIMLTVKLLKENPDVLHHYQQRFKYVLVDEYQDTNLAQFELVSSLCGYHKNLCVVGDDDQSIYGWRGADITNILSFEKRFDNCRIIKLEQNYRSTKSILEAANNVIRNNSTRKSKTLWTDNPEGEALTLFRAEDERDEASYVVSSIIDMCENRGRSYSDFAILYRANAQSRALEDNLIYQGVPYKLVGGTRFYERKEIKDIMAYLRVIQNPNDTISLGRIINVPKRGIGDATIERVMDISLKNGIGMFEVLKNAKDYPGLERSVKKLGEFAELIEMLRAKRDSLKASELISLTIEKSRVMEDYNKEDADKAQTRMENMEELITVAVELENRQEENALEDFLAFTSLFADIDNLEDDNDNVTLMTMHSAKGLEYPIVFIVGMDEGLFPRIFNEFYIDERELEEERRLCYVAITRARERLYLLCAQRRTLFGRTQYRDMSRFIKEIPKELIGGFNEFQNEADLQREKKQGYTPTPQKAAYSFNKATSSLMGNDILTKHENMQNIVAGTAVMHKKFGRGIVHQVKNEGGLNALVIDFEGSGRKTLMEGAVTVE